MQKSKIQFKIQKLKNIYHLFVAVLANLWYGFPSRKIKVVGVTGTDGKTTTTQLIYHILKTSGKKASMISSVFAKIAEKEYDTGFHVTTPDPFFIQKMLNAAVTKGDEYFVLETTSHALDQNRVWGINYEVGVLTNVTHEHLDYHQNYENYLRTKLKLMDKAKIFIINVDDEAYKYISQKSLLRQGFGGQAKVKSYGYKNKSKYKISFDLDLTEYNQYNYLAAYSVCRELGIEEKKILEAMKTFQLPKGRLDVVYDKDFKVIIDFAHTPNAIKQLLSYLKKTFPGRQIVHVFGSAGLRDASKRPLMGEASGKYADLVILTEEDYRTEDPIKICLAIALELEKQGFKKVHFNYLNNQSKKTYDVIIDREKAIRKAIELAGKGDIVVFTGKGHEKSLCREKREYEWDEREKVQEALKNVLINTNNQISQ